MTNYMFSNMSTSMIILACIAWYLLGFFSAAIQIIYQHSKLDREYGKKTPITIGDFACMCIFALGGVSTALAVFSMGIIVLICKGIDMLVAIDKPLFRKDG